MMGILIFFNITRRVWYTKSQSGKFSKPGHILEKKAASPKKKAHIFFIFKEKRVHFYFQGAHIFHATLMLIHETPEIGPVSRG